MTRPSVSSFNKLTPFQFPRAPLSPPETNVDEITPGKMLSSNSIAGAHYLRASEAEASPAYSAPTSEPAGARFRKLSSIAYNSSGLRESRERVPQRSPKAFVIVIPPVSFAQEHGQLGHTLSTGPRYRLSQGLLMPLFPTMYGQLTAIAREFNFPSTAGLCIYLHFVENGVTMTPRVSDESWPIIWSHVFEATTPSPAQRSPINGKIEFDIDIRQARWYASWMSSSNRDYGADPFSAISSTAPSVVHFHRESKTTFQEDQADEQDEGNLIPMQNSISAPRARHIPRKLSLVDRFDVLSARSASRPASRSALSPPAPQVVAQVLSPIVQEEEPPSAKHDLDSRVKSWRASAVLRPTPLAVKGQTSLEPANMPNVVPIDDALLTASDDELNLADFAWSISSAGPEDYDSVSPMSWDRVPSVHIASRMQGSVCLTPSDCTSFGPSDYTLPSPNPSSYRLPSPDIAHRMYEDAPLTPSTATSWGAPLSYAPLPFSPYRAPSLDLGERAGWSRPVTPGTATSWGPASWPSSPISSEYRARSVHLGDRGEFSRPVTPSTATSWGAPLSYPPSPTTPFYVSSPDAGHRAFDDFEQPAYFRPTQGISGTPPQLAPESPDRATDDYDRSRTISWPRQHVSDEAIGPLSVHHSSAYPRLVIYQSVYPHFHLYPAVALAKDDPTYASYPHFDLYPPVPLDIGCEPSVPLPAVIVKLSVTYPHFDLYPAVYPGNLLEIYAPVVNNDCPAISVRAPSVYPFFDLYPAVYPYITPYPQAPTMHAFKTKVARKTSGYPCFDLYPAIRPPSAGYPDFTLYPALSCESEFPSASKFKADLQVISLKVTPQYPWFDLYPAVYPYVMPYPLLDVVDAQMGSPHTSPMVKDSRSLSAGYPNFRPYPPISVKTSSKTKELSVRLDAYPVFNLYPAVYPVFDIYPAIEHHDLSSVCSHVDLYPSFSRRKGGQDIPALTSLSVRAPCSYPMFNLYPPVYPFLDIYPALPQAERSPQREEHSWTGYPKFNLYPSPGYPDFDLYPSIYMNCEERKPVKVKIEAHYPAFDLYPAVYPHFNIWPSVNEPRMVDLYPSMSMKYEERKPVTVKIEAHYPAFDLYPAVYPHFNIWPSVNEPRMTPLPIRPKKLSSRLTHSELHAMVMMERVRSTGSFRSMTSTSLFPDKPVRSHHDHHNTVFPSSAATTLSGTTQGNRYTEHDNKGSSDEGSVPRRASSLRPVSTRLPPSQALSPNRNLHLHSVPTTGSRLSSAFESLSTPELEVPKLGVSPTKRSPGDLESRLTRSASLKPRGSVPKHGDRLDRSDSLSTTPRSSPVPRRRDSVVLQRVRAYDHHNEDSQHLMDTLSKFPAPPLPPNFRSPAPKPLDRSQYPFAVDKSLLR